MCSIVSLLERDGWRYIGDSVWQKGQLIMEVDTITTHRLVIKTLRKVLKEEQK